MSFLTGTNTEVIAANAAPAAQLLVSASYLNYTVGPSAAYLPIGFFGSNCVGKTLRMVCDGSFTTPGSATSFQMAASFDTTQGTTAALQAAASGAVIPPSTITLAFWRYDVELTVQSITTSYTTASNVANIIGFGLMTIGQVAGPGITAASTYTCGSQSVTAVPMESAYFLELAIRSSAATASETLRIERSTVYGCN